MKLPLAESTGLVLFIGSVLNNKVSQLKFPINLILFSIKLEDIVPFIINSDRLEKISKNYAVSNNKIKQGLQIEISPINNIVGLENTIKSFTE